MTLASSIFSPQQPARSLRDWGTLAGSIGLGAWVLLLIALIMPAERPVFFRAYLAAFLLVLGISLGCMANLMLHNLVGGAWGEAIRPINLAAAAQLPLLLVLFVPVALGVHALFPWANAQQVQSDPILQHRSALFNTPFWVARAAVCFLLWIIMGRFMIRRTRAGSAPGLVIFFVTVTVLSVDWLMSREPHWYSTVLGFLIAMGQGVSGCTFAIAVLALLTTTRPSRTAPDADVLNDLGNFLLTLIILWAYMNLAQLLVVWMGNTRGEITWYTERGLSPDSPNAWRWVGLLLALLHFFVPFFLLLFREHKRNLAHLCAIAVGLLVLRQLDMIFLTAPTITTEAETALGGAASWMDLAAPLALGGIWFFAFTRSFESANGETVA